MAIALSTPQWDSGRSARDDRRGATRSILIRVQMSGLQDLGRFELSVVKNVDGHDRLGRATAGAVGLWLVTLAGGLAFGGAPGEPDGTGTPSRARYLVKVRDKSTGDVRIVRTAITRWGANASVREVRRMLKSGNEHRIRSVFGPGA